MIETTESKHRRMGHEKPLDHNEATQLKRTKTNELDDFEVRQQREIQRQMDMAVAEAMASKMNENNPIQAKV